MKHCFDLVFTGMVTGTAYHDVIYYTFQKALWQCYEPGELCIVYRYSFISKI